MKFLILALVCLSGIVSGNEEDLLKAFIPEEIIRMVIDLINSIDFSKVWELVKMMLCGEEGDQLEKRSLMDSEFGIKIIKVIRYAVCGEF